MAGDKEELQRYQREQKEAARREQLAHKKELQRIQRQEKESSMLQETMKRVREANGSATGGFVKEHPWLTTLLALVALGTVATIATGGKA